MPPKSAPVQGPLVRWFLLFLLVVQLVLLTSQVADRDGERSRLEALSLRVVAPPARAVEAIVDLVSGVPRGFATRRQLKDENVRLQAEVNLLRRQHLDYLGMERELERLAASVEYSRETEIPLRAADVVYADHVSSLRILLARVPGGGVGINQPVLSTQGLVGRVVLDSGPWVKVQLITDRAASVGAMIERTRRQGVVRGGEEGYLDLDFVPQRADVKTGDRVVTAGIDGVYPRGIAVGVVSSVERGTERFLRIQVTPAVDFGVLDQVLIMARDPLPPELRGGTANAKP